jgi:hypothetical protein
MRKTVVLSAAGLALLILAPAIYLKLKPQTPDQPAPAAEVAATAPASNVPAVTHHPRVAAPADGGLGVPVPDAATELDPEDYTGIRQRELADMGMSDDPADLKGILAELNNKNPDIRKSALSAAVQFGSKDAIPALQNELAWTEDLQEKVDIQNAIKFLQLPSFGEVANTGGATPQPSNEQPPPTN